jgi:high-affinity nickel-transport protein
VAICFFIGTIEVLGLLPNEIGGLHGSFWSFMANFDINKAGFVIVAMFIVTWVAALSFWKLGHVEEKWHARLKPRQAAPPRLELALEASRPMAAARAQEL